MRVRIENTVSPTPDHSQSNRMGLEMMERQLGTVNGSLLIRDSNRTWQTELTIPLNDMKAHQIAASPRGG